MKLAIKWKGKKVLIGSTQFISLFRNQNENKFVLPLSILTIVRFLALVTTMVTTVDHGNDRSNDRGNDRSNHRGYYVNA